MAKRLLFPLGSSIADLRIPGCRAADILVSAPSFLRKRESSRHDGSLNLLSQTALPQGRGEKGQGNSLFTGAFTELYAAVSKALYDSIGAMRNIAPMQDGKMIMPKRKGDRMNRSGLRQRLIIGFFAVAVILVIGGLAGWKEVKSTSGSIDEIALDYLPAVHSLQGIQEAGALILAAQRTLLIPGIAVDQIEKQYSLIEKKKKACRKLMAEYAGLPHSENELTLWKEFLQAWEICKKNNKEFMALSRALVENGVLEPNSFSMMLQKIQADHYQLAAQVGNMLQTEIEFEGGEDPGDRGLEKWRQSYQTQNPVIQAVLKEIKAPNDRFYQAVSKIKQAVRKGNIEEAAFIYETEMLKAGEEIGLQFKILNQQADKAEKLYQQMRVYAFDVSMKSQLAAVDLLNEIVHLNMQMVRKQAEYAMTNASHACSVVQAGIVLGLLLALGLGFRFSSAIVGPINHVITGLDESAGQIGAASSQIASSGAFLADAANHQAAGLEEKSASLQAMSLTVQSTSELTAGSQDLMNQNIAKSAQSLKAIVELTRTMTKVEADSGRMIGIINTIDELSFQTNLLALNAAVEAARAGQAGAGFAVVAEEVKQLAGRSAQAAKDTQELLNGTVGQVKTAAEAVKRVNTNFEGIIKSATIMGEKIVSITDAAKRQSKELRQMTSSIQEIEKTTQQVASNAEEFAATSEELSAQARHMNTFVSSLNHIVKGNQKNADPSK